MATSRLLKIIVGVDYGTTFSGISYVASNETSADKIEILSQWPGTRHTVSKVPTSIAYASENPHLNADAWGFAVALDSVSYTWTKLLLDGSATIAENDDPALKDLFGKGMMKLPPGKTAKQVCTDYLRGLSEYLSATLCKKFSREVYSITPVELWLTVPAIWSDAAKDATRNAAVAAGFASRSFDRIHVIPEPEAAALAALKPHLSARSLDPIIDGETVLVCDCGGGTVDITTYRILSAQPALRFEELAGCVGAGAKCGSTYIDRNFNAWMTKTFGKAFTDLPQKRRGPGSAFMNSFETQKRAFGSKTLGRANYKHIQVDHINMAVPASSSYDPDDATVKITWHQMKGFFDTVVDEIIRLIEPQVKAAKMQGHDISRIILVGGFGDSDYLNERIAIWCSQHPGNIRLTCPPQCQAAVVRGAAIRGLEDIQPVTRLARRHYGYSICKTFRPGIYPESQSFIDRFNGKKMCRGRLSWKVSKGQVITSTTEVSFTILVKMEEDDIPESTLTLYACSSNDPPEYKKNHAAEKIGEVRVRWSLNDFDKAEKRFNQTMGAYVWCFEYEVKMQMNAEDGLLKFKTFAYGKPAGETTIDY
ncbi:hsp70-like protein [Phyllosticta capitalensis]|uniref:hsp70-like protein n=1 Tax=Phyllosticta capitalensis TaxID=121624 RepID=UPI00312D2B3B